MTSPAVNLTAGRIAELSCPPGKAQVFLKDIRCPWLSVRVTSSQEKAYVFEAKLRRKTIRQTIGSVNAWTIERARQVANEKKTLVDQGIDPRAEQREAKIQAAKQEAEDAKRATTVATAWADYLDRGRPRKKKAWKPRYREDLVEMASAGGAPLRRGKGIKKPGPLHALMADRLVDLNADHLRSWFIAQAKRGPVQADRARAMFSGFLNWCSKQPEYRDLVDKHAATASELEDLRPPTRVRKDRLQRNQLPAFFAALRNDPSPIGAAYLVASLLCGPRRQELAALKHSEIDYRWRKFSVADKVGDRRELALTTHLEVLFTGIPKASGNPYVFHSARSKSGHISEPRSVLERVLKKAGIPHISVHGLRRSFASLSEGANAPAGVAAQVMGHSPSATHEKYKPRDTDELAEPLQKIQDFILRLAGVETLERFLSH